MQETRYVRNSREMGPLRRIGQQLLMEGKKQSDVARELGVSRTTASNWAAKLLHTDAVGRGEVTRRMTRPEVRALDRMIEAGAGYFGFPNNGWTIARIAVLVEYEFGLAYSAAQLRHTLETMLAYECLPRIESVIRGQGPGAGRASQEVGESVCLTFAMASPSRYHG
ncbi:hypothetical protein GCM10027321_16310 [Massilia terrae]|uniref:Transposase n=1 Tax=Massilia terrae TaxID=1811224 RepID=A0ABT2D4L1_9BURK|nr:hypothetical protein [Massilia terrae]MCS0661179.1 hypothetical protein [Massilia terrae]